MTRLLGPQLVLGLLLLAGCSPRLAPFAVEAPRVDAPRSVATDALTSLPPPQEPVVVAVYRFRDQTGQYRALENVSTFSTAVTQGATTILVSALESSGWFVPIEREGLSNLLNERQIIQSTRQQYTGPEGEGLPPLPPLLYAGILLEGGIIGYDSNTLTGGVGARYLGTGVSGQFRQDQVTIYLRAVSVQNGRVLKTVRTTKTIVSQTLDGGLFRFIDVQRLLETEAGYSANEPPVLAVTAAIEEAVRALVIEGTRDGLWQLADNAAPEAQEMFAAYDAQVDSDAQRDVYDRVQLSSPGRFSAHVAAGAGRIEDDFIGTSSHPIGSLAFRYAATGAVELGTEVQLGFLDVSTERERFGSVDAHVRWAPYRQSRVRPYASLGAGVLNLPDVPRGADTKGFLSTSAGVQFRPSRDVGLTLGVANQYPFTEGLDGFQGSGATHDNLWSLRAGVVYSGLGF